MLPTPSFVPFPPDAVLRPIGDRLEYIAARHPDRIAVRDRGESVTYRELCERSRIVGRAVLAELGEGNEPVALLLHKSAWQLAAIFGVLMAGKAYVPLFVSAPGGYNTDVLADAGARLLIAEAATAEAARALAGADRVLVVDSIRDSITDSMTHAGPIGLDVSPNAHAYILYTSGSTGRPKGVVDTHRNIQHNIANYTNAAFLSADDRMTLLGSCAFSGSLKDYYGALLNGATLCLFDVETEGLAALAAWTTRERITIWVSVPSVFRHFIDTLNGDDVFPDVRIVRLGGETVTRLDFEAMRRHFPGRCELLNGCGGTETGTTLLYVAGATSEWDGPNVPIGFPVDGYEVLLLDEEGQEVGPDEVGEIVPVGPYISPGYWRRSDLTEAAFRPDPQGGDRRRYFTGDLGVRRSDGCFFHAGRKDFQLRVRGFRVEAGEVEAAVLAYPGVRETVVVAREGGLSAYVTLAPGTTTPAAASWRAFLSGRLPAQAVPAHVVVLDHLPYNANGKINRRALPAPPERRTSPDFVAPRTVVEERLARTWCDALGVSSVGVDDDFFALGGDSLKAAGMLARVEREFGVRWPLATLVDGVTIAGLARRLGEKVQAPSALVPLQPHGAAPRFFCVHAIGGEVLCYRDLVRHLGQDQPFFGVQSLRLPEGAAPPSIEDMAAAYLAEIRALQPEGPYFLGGYSMGGAVAYEMAQQLRREQQRVAALVVIDQRRPNLDPTRAWKPGLMVRLAANAPGWLWYDARREGPRKIMRRARRTFNRFSRTLRGDRRPNVADVFDVDLVPSDFQVLAQANYAALRAYRPEPWDGPFTLLQSRAQPLCRWHEPVLGWTRLVRGPLTRHILPGAHDSILTEPYVAGLAREIAAAIARGREDASPGG